MSVLRARCRRRSTGLPLLAVVAAGLFASPLSAGGGAGTAIGPGTDQFPSVAQVNYTIDFGQPTGLTEQIELSSKGLPDAIVQRGPLVGDTIETEIVAMELLGQSPALGKVIMQVGREYELQPTLGRVTDVHVDKDGNFLWGDSTFDVFFGFSAFKQSGEEIHARNPEAMRVQARITSLPPNKPVPPRAISKKLDHFKCYQVKPQTKLVPRAVALSDQFEGVRARIVSVLSLCAPVSKNREPLREPRAHLKCYALADDKLGKQRDVDVTDQFGSQTLTVVNPISLCAPSLKSFRPKRPPPGLQPERLLDHFKCYQVRPKAPFQARTVRLEDQFERERAKVLSPVALCSPVDKDKGGLRDPYAHLTCYAIQDLERTVTSRERVVVVRNQFGTETLTVLKAQTLCVPSTKRPPCSEYAERTKAALEAAGQPIGRVNEAIHIPFLKAEGSACQ